MNRSILLASCCAVLLTSAVTAHAGSTDVAAAEAAPAAIPAMPTEPVVGRPKADPTVEKMLTGMNTASTWGHPDQFGEFAGMRLYSEGNYGAAIKYFKYGARYADKLSQLSIGLMYENGRGVKRNPVTACAWLALAAQRKFPSFIATRDRVCKALTPAQHDQAVAVLDKLLPVYGDEVAKPRMAKELRLAKMQTTGSRLGFDSGIDTASTNPNCGGPTIGDAPVAGCGSSNFWSPWRWDPKKYFAARDAQWRGTVTVGALQDKNAPAPGAGAKRPNGGAKPGASAGH
jgi:hypothetical protein